MNDKEMGQGNQLCRAAHDDCPDGRVDQNSGDDGIPANSAKEGEPSTDYHGKGIWCPQDSDEEETEEKEFQEDDGEDDNDDDGDDYEGGDQSSSCLAYPFLFLMPNGECQASI